MLKKDLVFLRVMQWLKPGAKTTTNGNTSAALDVRQFEAVMVTFNCAKASAGTLPTMTPGIVHSDAEAGSYAALTGVTWLDEDRAEVDEVTDAADVAACAIIDVRDTDGWIKFAGAIAGANASFDNGVTVHVLDKYPSL